MSTNGQPPGGNHPNVPANAQNPQHPPAFDVDLPAGGRLQLRTADEVDVWNEGVKAYKQDYALTRTNDLVMLGALMTQQLAMYRAQMRLNGMEAELDANQVPTGRYRQVELKPSDEAAAQEQVRKAAGEIRDIEKSLGINKATRDQGGGQNVRDYLAGLKRAAHRMGVHISNRVLAYENFAMELRTKLRMLENLDEEDRRYEGISEESIIAWARNELAKLEEIDKQYAKEHGLTYVGKV